MDEITLLRGLDHDDAAGDPGAKQAARSALRAHIAAAQQATAPAHRGVVRRVGAWRSRLRIAAAVAAVLVVAVVAAIVLPGHGSRPAYAATPPLLMPVDDAGRPAERVLERLAAAADEQPPLPGGRYHHLKTASWYLHTTVYNEDHAESVIMPSITERWVAEDGSGLEITASGEPVDAGPPGAEGDRRAIEDLPDGEGEVTEYPAGEWPITPAAGYPRDPSALREQLLTEHGDNDDRPAHVQLFVELQEGLLTQQRVPPDLLATFYRALATAPDMRAYGQVTDRAGRRGIAVGFDYEYDRYMLIVDRETGTPLGFEEILTSNPGELDVRVPAVTSYVVYLAGGDVASTEQRGPRIP